MCSASIMTIMYVLSLKCLQFISWFIMDLDCSCALKNIKTFPSKTHDSIIFNTPKSPAWDQFHFPSRTTDTLTAPDCDTCNRNDLKFLDRVHISHVCSLGLRLSSRNLDSNFRKESQLNSLLHDWSFEIKCQVLLWFLDFWCETRNSQQNSGFSTKSEYSQCFISSREFTQN